MECTTNAIKETKRLISWIGKNSTEWENVTGRTNSRVSFFDSIQVIKKLQKEEFYTQILNFSFNTQNEIEDIAISAILEEIIETWGREEWDDVVNKIIRQLEEAHQEAKVQRKKMSEIML